MVLYLLVPFRYIDMLSRRNEYWSSDNADSGCLDWNRELISAEEWYLGIRF